jgi:hypothetical protein
MEQFVEYGITERDAHNDQNMNFNGMNLDPNAKNYSNCDIAGSFYEIKQNRGSFTAFGYEQDEKIVYALVEAMTKEEILTSEYLKLRTVPKGNYSNFFCHVDRYFDKARFFDEDTGYRVLFKMDGTILVRGLFDDLTKLPASA